MKLRTIFIMIAVLAVVGVLFFAFGRGDETAPQTESRPFVWSIDLDELKKIAITLRDEGKREAWVKQDNQFWYFDQPNGPQVDTRRWGGGIPLILSGPGAERLISDDSTSDQLKMYGLQDPRMTIHLVTESDKTLEIAVGDPTPGLQAYYIRTADSTAVFSVDYSWYDVLERLVLDPPYPEPQKR